MHSVRIMTAFSPLRPPAPAPAPAPAPVRPHRPTVTELRLSAFGPHRGAVFPLGPLTFFAGPSGSGKTTVLDMYDALARLGAGDVLDEVFPDPSHRVPESAVADGQGRRGFRSAAPSTARPDPYGSISPSRRSRNCASSANV